VHPAATGSSHAPGVVVVVVIEQSDHDNDNDNDQDSVPGISVTTSVLIAPAFRPALDTRTPPGLRLPKQPHQERTMTAITFDTLKYAERLEAGGFPPQQAKAEAQALADVLSSS
jgi:hypothetical protein